MKILTSFDFSQQLQKLNNEIATKNATIFETGFHPTLGGGGFFRESATIQERVNAVLEFPFIPISFLCHTRRDGNCLPLDIRVERLVADYLKGGNDMPLNPLISDFSKFYIDVEFEGNKCKVYANEPFHVHF